MKTLAVIPARLGASRLPRKPLRLVGGAPLILRVWQRVAESGAVDAAVVATDDEEIAGVVRAAGGSAVMTRHDHPSGTDRVAEAADRSEFLEFGVIVNVQGDEPFMPDDALRGVAAMVAEGRFPLATAAAHATPHALAEPNVVKVVCANDGRAMYFSRAAIPYLRDAQDRDLRDAEIRQHLGIYAYTREALQEWVRLPVHPLERVERLEQLRPLAAGLRMGVMTVDAAPPGGVDTEDDLLRANAVWNELYAGRS